MFFARSQRARSKKRHRVWSLDGEKSERPYRAGVPESVGHVPPLGISDGMLRKRLSLGWSLERALTTPVMDDGSWSSRECADHLGESFPSVNAMCAAWGVRRDVFNSRIKRGWTLEKALSTPTRGHEVTDHTGAKFENTTQMCRSWGIDPQAFWSRRSFGWSLERALTTPLSHSEIVTDHEGSTYSGTTEMCAAWGIDPQLFRQRISRGWSVERALTTPVEEREGTHCTDHEGAQWRSIREMCTAWGVFSPGRHRRRPPAPSPQARGARECASSAPP